MVSLISFVFNVTVAYLVGSINAALIVSKLFDLPDPRVNGSQNPGATNVLRLAGKTYALYVLVADVLKGLLPVLLAKMVGAGPVVIAFTCLAAVVGHIYPIFFGFKGGKGVATAIGALLGFHFMLGVVLITAWILIAKFTHYSSLASIICILFSPFLALFTTNVINVFLPLMLMASLIIYEHRYNIIRLMDGKESKFNFNQPVSDKGGFKEQPVPETKAAPKTPKARAKPRKTQGKASTEKKTVKAKKTSPKK